MRKATVTTRIMTVIMIRILTRNISHVEPRHRIDEEFRLI